MSGDAESATDTAENLGTSPTRSLRYRARWRAARVLMRSRRLCPMAVGSWAQYGGEIRERRYRADWCRQNDLVDGQCGCNLINEGEGRG